RYGRIRKDQMAIAPEPEMRKQLPFDPSESARIVGLRYVAGDQPGIRRQRVGRGWRFTRPNGRLVKSLGDLTRIGSLAIPPAWVRVWICPDPTGHLQAVGYDQRGRKQYRYHPAFREVRNATKFTRMAAFGTALPKIRRRVEKD